MYKKSKKTDEHMLSVPLKRQHEEAVRTAAIKRQSFFYHSPEDGTAVDVDTQDADARLTISNIQNHLRS